MRIAFVDDDADSALVFSRKLRMDGHACDVFPDAESALEAVSPGSHDALVIDFRLPGMSGLRLLSSLRERGVHAPAVLITAFADMRLATEALNASANYLLEKPFDYAALRGALRRVEERPASLQHFVDRGLARLGLSAREEEAARLLLKGLGNADIARAMGLSEKTVKQYVTATFEKAGVSSRAELFSWVFPT